MKRIVAILLSFVLVLSLAACSKQAETETAPEAVETVAETAETESIETESEEVVYTESIPLGGNCGDLPIVGKAYGSYKEIEPTGIFAEEDSVETHVYYDAESDTPYIATYRWAKDGQTLEEAVKEECEIWSDGHYQMVDASDWGYVPGDKAGYYCDSVDGEDGEFYFGEVEIFEDGDEFVEVLYSAKSEEVQLGDSDMYINIPAGYDDISTADDNTHGRILTASYDDSYYLPTIYIDTTEISYDYMKWYWSDLYPDGIPYTEEQYQEGYIENFGSVDYWTEEKSAEYYACFGGKMTESFGTMIEGVYCYVYGVDFESAKTTDTDIFFIRNDECYEVWTETEHIDCVPYISDSIINSLHRKSSASTISLGGNCGDIELKGIAYGDYKEVPVSGWFEDEDSYEIHLYEDKAADVPYIVVYRDKKNGKTLAEMAESELQYYNTKNYETTKTEKLGYEFVSGDEVVTICGYTEMDGQFYYIDNMLFEDGDDFVTICWFNKSVEVPLSDSGKNMWVPAGLTSILNDDEVEHGACFWGTYDESYFKPSIWVGKGNPSYEYQEWFWEDIYTDGLPFTKDEYDAVIEKLPYSVLDNNGEYDEYYDLFGYELYKLHEFKVNDVIGSLSAIRSEELGIIANDIIIEVDGEYYHIFTTTEMDDDVPYFGGSIIKSIH